MSAGARGPTPRCSSSCATRTGATEDDLRSTFNLGVGMVLVVPPDRAEDAIAYPRGSGSDAFPIGLVRA